MSKRGVVNVDLNNWYNSDVQAFLLTKRLDIGDEGKQYRELNGFDMDGLVPGVDTWQARLLRAKAKREKEFRAKNMHVYNSATPAVQRPMTAPA
jgi:hypothetical protein